MAFKTLNFSNKMSSRISLEIKCWITFNTGPETRNFQGASAQKQLAQQGSTFPKKSLIFISKMAILGSFRGGSEVAFVTSVFFALSSGTYCAALVCAGSFACFGHFEKVSAFKASAWSLFGSHPPCWNFALIVSMSNFASLCGLSNTCRHRSAFSAATIR